MLAFFLVSLVYLAYSITIALHVHGDIQGDVIDFNDLNTSHPETTLDEYNFNAAKPLLICGKLNWCLNNNFKFRLQSAGRALRNGVIAAIVAGALSPWALTSGGTSAPSGLDPATPAAHLEVAIHGSTACGTLQSADGGVLRLSVAGAHEPTATPLTMVTNIAIVANCP